VVRGVVEVCPPLGGTMQLIEPIDLGIGVMPKWKFLVPIYLGHPVDLECDAGCQESNVAFQLVMCSNDSFLTL